MKKVVLGFVLLVIVICSLGVVTMALGSSKESPGVAPSSAVPRVSLAPGTIEAGTWEVGTDVKVGKYKTSGAVAGDIVPLCYWHVEKAGTILRQGVKDKPGAQDIVTLAAGETFETTGCEPWYASK